MANKRKSSELEAKGGSSATVKVDNSRADIQPVLATFSAVAPPVASTFTTFKSGDKDQNQECLVVSEGDKVEYVGQSSEDGSALFKGCKYMVGVYDKATNTVTFRRAPLVRINTVVKSLKSSRGVKEHDISNRILEARNELGEKFGNKKRKAQIRAEERNRINMDQIQGSAGIISTSIEARTTSMPTSKDLADEADQNRPLPNYDSTTTVPADVYDMEDVLSKAEALHINVSSFVKAKSPDDYKRFIPVQSTFVSAKVDKILDSGKPNLALLRRALFLAYLMKFATMRGKATQSRDAAAKQMRCAPEIADVIFEKFAECVAGALNPDGSPVYKKTPGMDNKLICYIAILMLSLNEWIMYPSAMAADLGMPTKKAEKYLESVGCKLEAASKEEIARFSSGKRATGAPKKAVLKAPVSFPKEKSGPSRR